MIPDDVGQGLHSKATRGQQLSPEERSQLQQWYTRMYEEEAAQLSKAALTPDLAALREQLRAMVAQLGVVAKQIEAQLAENEAIRQENAALLRELSQSGASQAS